MCEEHQFLKNHLKLFNFNFSVIFFLQVHFHHKIVTNGQNCNWSAYHNFVYFLFPWHCHKNVMKMWQREKNINRREITFPSQFGLNVMTTIVTWRFILWQKCEGKMCSCTSPHFYEKVTKMWRAIFCPHFLAHLIWKFPPC